MMRVRRMRARHLALAVAATLSGCVAEDTGLSPEDAALLSESESQIALGAASTCVDLVVGAVDEFPQWSSADFVATLATESSATWSAAEEAWIVRSLEEYGDDRVTGVADFTIRIQFIADGAPVQEPTSAVQRMDLSFTGTNLGIYPGDSFETEYDWALEMQLSATRGVDGSKRLSGTGGLVGSTVTRIHEREYAREQDVAMNFDLSIPDGTSCASGTLTGTMGELALSAAFDGSGGVTRTMTRAGIAVDEDATAYECGALRPTW